MPEDDDHVKQDQRNGHIDGVNQFSADIAQLNVNNLRKTEPKTKLAQVAEEDGSPSSSEERWKAVSSVNYKSVTRTELWLFNFWFLI